MAPRAAADNKMSKPRSYPLLSRRQIEGMIAEGRYIIIVDQFVLKVDYWLPYHPGGDKAIQHMVGRDATDEVTVFVLLAPIYKYPPGRQALANL